MTFAILALVATAVVSLAMRAFVDTATIAERRDVFADGRVALDRLSKQLRQAEAVDRSASSPTQIEFAGYLDGSPATFVWRTSGSEAPYRLQESRDGGVTFTTIVSSLASPNVFTYTEHAGVLDQVTIQLVLRTKTSTIPLTTDVYLRNTND